MSKDNVFGLIAACILLAAASFAAEYVTCDRTHTSDNNGIGEYQQRERELLSAIGEYQQREAGRIAAENARISAERARIAATEAAIGALRQSDRRTSSLLQELAAEVDVLENYFRGSIDVLGSDAINNTGN